MLELPEVMTIGEAAAKTGVRSSALRFYESIGLLPAPRRVSGQRRYGAGTLTQIAFIQAAQSAGFSLEEIRTLLNSSSEALPYSARLRELAHRKLPQAEAVIAQAQAQKVVLEAAVICCCHSLQECPLFAGETP